MIGNANEAVATSCEQVFDQFISAVTCKSILSSFNQLLDVAELRHVDHRHFYETLKTKLKKSWKAQSLWTKLDKRASHRDYKNQQACANMKVLVIGSGPCGLRTAIECAFLGAKTVIVEKRDRFSRNNVLHLWPYLITDLRNLGAKKFFGKFCAGAIDHISIRQLQCILLKVALLLGVEVHVNVSFEHLIEPQIDHSTGWHCKVSPENHPVSEYEFNALIAADGKRNTLPGFRRKEFRGKLAIAVTANFINRNTQAEARVEEISGVAFIFNQKFFLDLKEKTRIDLENIVYYKDDTHYFVMTAKKASLLEKGVLKEDYTDTVALLDRSNVNQEALMAFAREAADFSTNYQLPCLEYAVNHYGQADVAMFDFTSMFAAENASRFINKNGYHLLMGLVGDTLLEPFWPTGSGCARGFLGAFDAAWMIRSWALGRTPLQVLSERESIFTVLSQTTPNYLHKNHNAYSLDPNTRYPNLNLKAVKPNQVKHLYDGGVFSEKDLEDEEIVLPPHVNKVQNDATIDSYTLLRWCQKVLNTGKYRDVHIVDFTSSWRSGLALCALIHSFRPELIQNTLLMECEVVANNKLAFSVAEKELGIAPVMAGEDMAKYEVPDKLTMIAYLSQFYELFKNEPLPSTIPLPSKPKRTSLAKEVAQPKPSNSPKKHSSLLQKLKLQSKKRKDQEENEEITFGSKKRKDKKEIVEVELTHYNKLPMEEIANRLQLNRITEDARLKISKNEERSGAVSVTAMADLLVSKFKSIEGKPPQELIRKMKGQPTLLAATPESEFCSFCHKRVYIMERMSAEGEFFHRQCFKCDHCGVSLRLTNYSCDRDIKPVKFYCYRHALPELRVKTLRQRSLDGKDIDQLQQIFTPSSIDMDIVNLYSEKTDSSQLTSQMLAKDVTESKNMPERVEFEISFDGCEEESEEEQFEHNLRASLSNPLSDDNEESDSDSYSDFDSDDELWESALESLKSPLLSSELQRSWHAYQEDSLLNNDSHSLEYLSFRTEHDKENEESSTEVEQDSDDEGSESKKQEDTYDSSKEEVSQTTLLSPVSRISQSKANFFSEPPTVVSLDPWSMFGMGSRESQPKEEIKEEKLSSDHVLSTKNLEVEQLSSADSLDDLNMDVYMDNLPEEGATENKGDTAPYESSKNWELYSENDGDDEHGTDNGIGKSLVSEDIVSNEDSQFIEGRLSPSARKAKKYRMKRQSKHLKKTLHNVMSDSEVDKNVSDVNNFSCNDIEESHGVTNYADITLDMVSVVSDSSDIDDLIIANIDDRFVTSRMKKIKMSSHSRSKKKIHKKTKKNDSNFPPQVEQNVDSKVKLDIFSDITKPSILALTESFSDSSDASANDKVLESNSKNNHSVRVEPIKSEGQGISSIPSSPVDNQNESFCSENFFTPAQHFEESPFIIATDNNKNVCLDPVMLHKSDSNSSIQKTGSDLSNSHSQTSLQNTESLSSNQNTESYLKSSPETTEPKNSLPDLSALRISPRDPGHLSNVDTPIRTKVPVDKSRLLLGSSSDLAESDLEPESKRKISADGIFIDKTRALDIPFADESETDENFATPQVFDKTSFPPANPSICEQNLPLKVSAKVYVQDNIYVNKNPADLSKDNKESRISSLTLPLGAEVNTETADSNLGAENTKPEHNDSYTHISPNSCENISVLSSKVAVKNENKVSKKETKNELAICSVFHSEASKRKENIQSNLRRPISVASKVKCDDLSDELSDESHVSFKPMQKKADDLDARVARRLSRMHAKQQKRAEQRRLRMAQEIQRQLEEVEVRQRELEERGIAVEKLLRGDVSDDDDVDDAQLMSEWFSLVHEKNALLRYESELNVRAKELELEDRQARLESDYRERSKKSEKTEGDIAAEGELLNELVEVVEQRNNLVAMLEEDRLREQIEDYDLKKIMAQKGYLLSPLSCDVRREKEILHI